LDHAFGRVIEVERAGERPELHSGHTKSQSREQNETGPLAGKRVQREDKRQLDVRHSGNFRRRPSVARFNRVRERVVRRRTIAVWIAAGEENTRIQKTAVELLAHHHPVQ